MKYLKLYEEVNDDIKTGDQIVLINASQYIIKQGLGFENGGIYTVDQVDSAEDKNKYIFLIQNKGKHVWFQRKDIRLATPEDIEKWEIKNNSNKYNI